MNRTTKYISIGFLFSFCVFTSIAQKFSTSKHQSAFNKIETAKRLDSLWNVYNNKILIDTSRIKALTYIAFIYRNYYSKPDTAITLALQALKLTQSQPDKKEKKWSSKCLYIIANSYIDKSNYPKALEYHLKAIKEFEEIGDKKMIGKSYATLGRFAMDQSDNSKAFEYYLKHLKICEEIGDIEGLAYSYNNLGDFYSNISDYPKALKYYEQALQASEKIEKKGLIGIYYGNIGRNYLNQSNLPKALEYHLKAYKVIKEYGQKSNLAKVYGSMGELYTKLTNYTLAIAYCDSALQLNKEIGDIQIEQWIYEILASSYYKTGCYREAYETHLKFKTLYDSIYNTANNKKLNDIANKYEVEKTEAKQLKLDLIAKEEKKRQNILLLLVSGGLLFVVTFSVFVFRSLKITRRQKLTIEIKNKEVEEKNKEIIESISYAKRLQEAILPPQEFINKHIPDNFILYKPKDLVAGDFYWSEKINDLFFIAAADSTGHGVP
ncbi:MAG: protein serine/threonine phosphatase, partial [Bacteroidota bacterium]|nr:protein serine/threonine phosphatase [Bacteroidota bacterium]